MYNFIDAISENDRAGYWWDNWDKNGYFYLTNDKSALKRSLGACIGYERRGIPTSPLYVGLDLLNSDASSRKKIFVLILDGDRYLKEDMVNEYIAKAQRYGIQMYCINVGDEKGDLMRRIADETFGRYYYAKKAADVEKITSGMRGGSAGSVDGKDSDGDGLCDVYETNGMRLSNGQIVYTDPNKADSDGDGISDYDAMGGDPVVESYMIDGNVYSCTLFHSKVYGKLSKQFIYVDGTLNRDGSQHFEKMGYVPYSNRFLYQKYNIKRGGYSNKKDYEAYGHYNGESRTVYGDARVYNSFHDKLAGMSGLELYSYATYGTLALLAVELADSQAASCLYRYIKGEGGSYAGLADGGTREYIYASHRMGTNIFGINSAHEYFISNMEKARVAAESVLNKYNREVYISLSPETKWCGCEYHDCTGLTDWKQNMDALLNIGAFGIYNKADAGVTLHCMYNPDEEEYYMEYVYYIIDFYDFTFYDILDEMNALGLARSYELYGVVTGEAAWNKQEGIRGY